MHEYTGRDEGSGGGGGGGGREGYSQKSHEVGYSSYDRDGADRGRRGGAGRGGRGGGRRGWRQYPPGGARTGVLRELHSNSDCFTVYSVSTPVHLEM